MSKSDATTVKRYFRRATAWPGPSNEHRDAHEIEHHGRHVQHVVGPVAPTGQETVEVAENFLGPQVNATFAGITMRQLDHGNSLRPEKEHEGNHPKPNGDSTIRGDARNHVQIEHRDDEERDEIPTAERTLQMTVRRLRQRTPPRDSLASRRNHGVRRPTMHHTRASVRRRCASAAHAARSREPARLREGREMAVDIGFGVLRRRWSTARPTNRAGP